MRLWLPEGVALYTRMVAWASLGAIVFVALYTVYSGVQFARINWHALKLGDAA